jgi:hypothetical protein
MNENGILSDYNKTYDLFYVKMKVNKNYKVFTKNQPVDVIISYYDGFGGAVFETIDGLRIPEKYLDVVSKEKDPEYFL